MITKENITISLSKKQVEKLTELTNISGKKRSQVIANLIDRVDENHYVNYRETISRFYVNLVEITNDLDKEIQTNIMNEVRCMVCHILK